MSRWFFLLFILFLFATKCTIDDFPDLKMQAREIAWNYLSLYDKSTVIIDWKEAEVNESWYGDKPVWEVLFPITATSISPIILDVDMLKKKVVNRVKMD
jgi:hypothetical protein